MISKMLESAVTASLTFLLHLDLDQANHMRKSGSNNSQSNRLGLALNHFDSVVLLCSERTLAVEIVLFITLDGFLVTSIKLATERQLTPPISLSTDDRPGYSNDELNTLDGFIEPYHHRSDGLGYS